MNENKQSTALIVILHKPEELPRLLRAWERVGVPGTTILPSMGGFQAQNQVRRGGLSGLLTMFTNNDEPGQRTIISLIDEPETLARAISEADRVVHGFDSPRSGILFTFPISNVLGLKKWREMPHPDTAEPEDEQEQSNLLKWFQEDLKEAYGREALTDWSRQRGMQVSQVIQQLDLDPIIVRVDTPIQEVLQAFVANPQVTNAAVVNTEGRLMGILTAAALANVLLAPVVPEAFIEDPAGYEQALKYAQPGQELFAADIMREPVYAMLDATLRETFQRMRESGLTGLPVVNPLYHVKGYITLVEIMSACFPTTARR